MLEAMAARLSHRGPDDRGTFVHRGLGLATTRLSIVDLSDKGAQPFRDENAALVFNGEIYNAATLGRRLEGEGVVFRGGSDTEVLFHALRRWGVEATLPTLEGMFAFAFADLVRQAVSLCRDRLGIKPLVWTEHGGDLAWASEAKGLIPFRPLRTDGVQSVFSVTGRLERSAHLTGFSGVNRLPAGHVLTATAGARPSIICWAPLEDLVDEAHHAELARTEPDELVRRLDSLLTSACERVGASDAPTGLFLSGGVDSSLVAALSVPRSPTMLSADIGGDRSEAPAAREVARHLDADLTMIEFPREALLEDWAVATWHAESPVVTHVNALPFRRLALAARDLGVKAVLTGEGADELFFGYAEIMIDALRRTARAPRDALRRAAAHLPGPVGAALGRLGVDQSGFLVDLAGGFRRHVLHERAVEAFSFASPQSAERSAATLVWLGDHLPTLLHRNDAMGMAASIEARFPYLDDELARFAVNLPPAAKWSLHPRAHDPRHPFVLDKALLRRVACRHLPASVAYRPKLGFPVHGYDLVRTSTAFWTDGYVVGLLGLDRAAIDHLVSAVDPYLAAKLASVEVFGRLFDLGHDIDTVSAHVRSHARMV